MLAALHINVGLEITGKPYFSRLFNMEESVKIHKRREIPP